jgi:hypothetical protein
MLHMFPGAKQARLRISKLPPGLKRVQNAFYQCYRAVINLDELTANAPAEGWPKVTSLYRTFYEAGLFGSPGVTGSQSAFLAKFPNVTITTDAFYRTDTTA